MAKQLMDFRTKFNKYHQSTFLFNRFGIDNKIAASLKSTTE